MLGAIAYQPRCATVEMRVLTGLVSVTLVQAWVLLGDFRWDASREEDTYVGTLRQFSRELADELKESFE